MIKLFPDFDDQVPSHTIDGCTIFSPKLKPMPVYSDRMIDVLYLLFDGEKPYEIYGNIADDSTEEEDRAFDDEVKVLRDYFSNQRKVSDA